jgi:hypothetical protein
MNGGYTDRELEREIERIEGQSLTMEEI